MITEVRLNSEPTTNLTFEAKDLIIAFLGLSAVQRIETRAFFEKDLETLAALEFLRREIR